MPDSPDPVSPDPDSPDLDSPHPGGPDPEGAAESNEDIKAKMREALARKNSKHSGVDHPAGSKEKAHGSEVVGGGPKMHRRKAGGGGS